MHQRGTTSNRIAAAAGKCTPSASGTRHTTRTPSQRAAAARTCGVTCQAGAGQAAGQAAGTDVYCLLMHASVAHEQHAHSPRASDAHVY